MKKSWPSSPQSFSREGSWNSLQDAMNEISSNISNKVRHILGPTREERHSVLGGVPANQNLEAMVNAWGAGGFGKNIIVMVGAGVSVSAGMPDFRDKDNGVYAQIRRQHGIVNPEDLFTQGMYESNPGPLCMWMQEFLTTRDRAIPTVTHLFLKILEERGCLLRCYTQNIDGLEQTAGIPSERIVMAHGDMKRPSCVTCGRPHDNKWFEDTILAGRVPNCEKCGAPVRPDIVFFSESTRIPHDYQKDFNACDLLLVFGTSLSVNPFASLATRVPILCPRMLINRDKVLINNCRHKSRQLDFDSPKAFRDAWLGGHCDESVRHLAAQLGWHDQLLRLESSFQPLCLPGSPSLPRPESRSSFGDTIAPSTASPSFGSDASDGVSELSEEDLATEGYTVSSMPLAHSRKLSPGMKNVWSNQSMASMASMISEFPEEESETELDLVDYGTGNIFSL